MGIVAAVVMMLYLVLFLLARRECVETSHSGIRAPFERMGLYLYKKICAKRVPIVGQKQVMKDLEQLHPERNKQLTCTDYYVGKIALCLMICLAGTVLGVIASVKTQSNLSLQQNGSIARGTFEEEAKEIELTASFENGGESSFRVCVETRQLTESELDKLMESFEIQLPDLIQGENISLQEVSTDLRLEESYSGYPFVVEWSSSRPELIGDTGKVYKSEETEEVVLTARILYEENREWHRQQEMIVCVVPLPMSDEEKLRQEMEQMLVAEEQASRLEEQWVLPESFQGKSIRWRQTVKDYSLLIWLGALFVAVLVFFFADKDVHDNLEIKRRQMKREYPDVVQKLALYLGAGMTVRAAFQKIAGNYEQDRKFGKVQVAIYEEMVYACRELQAGVSEGRVYEHFGKRVGLQEYVRLSTLLMQNLKKGNRTLLQRLKEEADKACIEQLQNTRRLGEEASTKLLLPMMLMLVVVMVLIMVPAFSSVGV